MQLVSATAAHESAATAAVTLEKQIGSFSSPGDGSLDTEQWTSASLSRAKGTGVKLSGLASSMAKAEAAAAASTSTATPAATFAAVFGVVTVAVWVTMFVANIGSGVKFWALAIGLSPVGAGLRYTLGLYNGKGPWGSDFPWGTAAANILGSGLSCLCCTLSASLPAALLSSCVSLTARLHFHFAVILSIESSKAGELHTMAQMSGEPLQAAIAADNSDSYLLGLHALATGFCVRKRLAVALVFGPPFLTAHTRCVGVAACMCCERTGVSFNRFDLHQ